MTSLLIGSKALKHWVPNIRAPKDIDMFSPVKVNGAECFWHKRLEDLVGSEDRVASLNELYTIKVSHSFWDVGWEKHMHDIIIMQQNGAQVIPELYDNLYKIWEERYGKKKAKLNVEPEEFFKSTVNRIYDHDSIHASIAYYDEPLFNKILKDGEKVAVDVDKFKALSLDDKLKLVREEVYATALERFIIPSNYHYSPRAAYAWAMKKTITSFSKGWFPYFIVTHYTDLYKPDLDYVNIHKRNKNKLILLGELR